MEDGLDSTLSGERLPEPIKNGIVSPIMANFPEGTASDSKEDKILQDPPKVNGEGNQNYPVIENDPFQDSYSSESDVLVIDESVPKKKRGRGKGKKNKECGWKTSEKENESSLLIASDLKEKSKTEKQSQLGLLSATKYDDVVINNKKNLNSELETTVPQISNENTRSSDNYSNSDASEQKISETSNYCDPPRLSTDLSNFREPITHSNPYFNQSLFELSQLSQLHHTNEDTSVNNIGNLQNNRDVSLGFNRTLKRSKVKPKVKEYAQYLGLQPAVQFKCSKCGKSGFESLITLQEHFLECNEVQSIEKIKERDNISGFKLTRKVFLCSSCGTYYENWNLYMHMLECHKRYICLYCLGMFSVLDDLCQHIQSRHNLEPGIKNTLEDFYNTYNEPCYVVCCECNRQFNEGENFFYHNCIPASKTTKSKPKPIKQIIAPENHVTGDFGTNVCEPSKKEEDIIPKKILQIALEKDKLPEPPEKGEENKADSDKHTLADEVSQSLSDNIDIKENKEEASSEEIEKPEVLDENSNNSESVPNIPDEILNKEDDSMNVDDNCDQDSLDSTRNSDENMESQLSPENNLEESEGNLSDTKEMEEPQEPVETRKVPKLSLKLPKPGTYPEPDGEDSDDSDKSDKLAMEVDNIESENENEHNEEPAVSDTDNKDQEDQTEELSVEEKEEKYVEPTYPSAGLDIPIVELELDQPLEKMDIQVLLQKCLRATVSSCIYCNHSRRIAVNGRQLGLHAMAEHRYSAINKSITEEELSPDSFNSRIKECLDQLETVYFNLDSGTSDEAVTFSHVFECFQCHYATSVHKELYLHNRKFHSKNLLLCIMCKSNFYSYSELICHLCPGVYVLDYDLRFRCCMCVSDDLPSSFRLMVHLRKRHNVCDVCLEMCHSQYKLSNHVWKHKLHHFCYRCGIAYRNKPDITRHLFWKHGTESVLCKKCLQKKWPHVYHFCVPPASFTCEECNLIFTRAVSLKVHKRLHTEEKKHPCTWEECTESFISKKLMEKHLKRHTEPPEEEKVIEEVKEEVEEKENENAEEQKENQEENTPEEPPKPVKPKVDVYDLPELNLSESDTSDSETEMEKPKTEESSETLSGKLSEGQNLLSSNPQDNLLSDQVSLDQPNSGDLQQPPVTDDASSTVIQDIWDNFKNYQANKEKMDNMFSNEAENIKVDQPYIPDIPIPIVEEGISWQLALRDHDYCLESDKSQPPDAIIEVKPALESTERVDHDYCFQKEEKTEEQGKIAQPPPQETPSVDEPKTSPSRKRTSSSSSSSSDSDSSCACGSSCSCSSSSGSSSSTSDSSESDSSTEEGRKRQQQRRLKRKERKQASKKQVKPETEQKVDVVTTDVPPIVIETPIRESDLETTESETDEEFYDREPQKFAKKILEEKRKQILAEMGPHMVPNGSFIESTSRPPTPPAGILEEEAAQPKKKKKTKKRKKRKSEKKNAIERRTYSATLIMDSTPTVKTPPTPPFYQPYQSAEVQTPTVAPITLSLSRNSPAPQTPLPFTSMETPVLARQDSAASDISLRSSKRRRVPNKFYGYSSDEESESKPPSAKRSKVEINKTIPAPSSPMLVPPITIKTVPSPMAVPPRPPMVEPITLRLPKPIQSPSDYRGQRKTVPPIRLSAPRIAIPPPLPPSTMDDSATESNDDSDTEEPPLSIATPSMQDISPAPAAVQPQLYCYCRCPYDEVSEMIGCDASDCQIEWFHFECVGIMVPPKGQWFCPDCRKRKQQQRRDLLA